MFKIFALIWFIIVSPCYEINEARAWSNPNWDPDPCPNPLHGDVTNRCSWRNIRTRRVSASRRLSRIDSACSLKFWHLTSSDRLRTALSWFVRSCFSASSRATRARKPSKWCCFLALDLRADSRFEIFRRNRLCSDTDNGLSACRTGSGSTGSDNEFSLNPNPDVKSVSRRKERSGEELSENIGAKWGISFQGGGWEEGGRKGN